MTIPEIYEEIFLTDKPKELFNSLGEEEKKELFKYAHLMDTDFSEVGNWKNGIAPTFKQSKDNILFIINDYESK